MIVSQIQDLNCRLTLAIERFKIQECPTMKDRRITQLMRNENVSSNE